MSGPEEGFEDRSSEAARAAMLPGAVAHEVVEALRVGGLRVLGDESASTGELVKALCKARLEFEDVVADQTATIPGKDGKAGYKYAYPSLGGALKATTGALARQELVIVQTFNQQAGEIEIVTTLRHSSDQFLRSRLSLETGQLSGPQQLGSLITYLRRYSFFGLLGLAPVDDDDGAAAQHHRGNDAGEASGSGAATLSVEDAGKLAAADPRGAFAAGKALIASVMGCGDISEPRLKRLYTLADKERGWSRDNVDAACERLLGVKPAGIPWKAYEVVVELFSKVAPDSLRAPAAAQPGEYPHRPPPGGGPAAGTGVGATEERLPWDEVWQRIAADFAELSPEARAETMDAQTLQGVLEGFARAGWASDQVEAVLGVELRITSAQLPRDGTNPPVFRKVARAFRTYGLSDLTAADLASYGWATAGAAPDDAGEGEAADGGEGIGELLTLLSEPADSAQGGWAIIRIVLDGLRDQAPDALAAMTPDDRLKLFRRLGNGNRSSGDVDALCQHYLGLRVEALPALLFDAVLRVLAAFPVRVPGSEEVLAHLPGAGAALKLPQMRDLVHDLIKRGALSDEEVPRSGEKGACTREDFSRAIELVRDRALAEAGHA